MIREPIDLVAETRLVFLTRAGKKGMQPHMMPTSSSTVLGIGVSKDLEGAQRRNLRDDEDWDQEPGNVHFSAIRDSVIQTENAHHTGTENRVSQVSTISFSRYPLQYPGQEDSHYSNLLLCRELQFRHRIERNTQNVEVANQVYGAHCVTDAQQFGVTLHKDE